MTKKMKEKTPQGLLDSKKGGCLWAIIAAWATLLTVALFVSAFMAFIQPVWMGWVIFALALGFSIYSWIRLYTNAKEADSYWG